MDNKKNLALGKVIVIIGFVLMSGSSSDVNQYNPEIFNATRTKVAPVVCLVGFLSIIAGIMYRPKDKE